MNERISPVAGPPEDGLHVMAWVPGCSGAFVECQRTNPLLPERTENRSQSPRPESMKQPGRWPRKTLSRALGPHFTEHRLTLEPKGL